MRKSFAIAFSITILFSLLGCGEHEHAWQAATCTTPKTCSVCGEIDGEPLGHDWQAATCTTPKTCSRCGQENGSPLGHTVEEWVVTEEASCTKNGSKEGTCEVCGEKVVETIPMANHVEGDWEIVIPATTKAKGTKEKHCINCGKVLASENYSLSAAEWETAYKQECISVTFEDLSRAPDLYKGKLIKVTGEVVQTVEASSADYYCTYRVDITRGSYGFYSDTVYINYDGYGKTPRILEDDIVTFWGEYQGLTSYETVFGATVTLPYIIAEYASIN